MKVVITGANRGIGLELAKVFSAKGDEVWALCRQASEELKSCTKGVIEGADVTNSVSLKDKVKQLPSEIDVLINNAGILVGDSLDSLNEDDVFRQFQVNAMGPLNVTLAFLPCLKKGSKVAMITSRMGSIQDNTSGGYYGYRASKAALNSIGKSLSEDLKPKGIAVALLHPGFVKTRMTGFNGEIDPTTAAAGLYERIQNLNLQNTGGFWHSNGEKLPW